MIWIGAFIAECVRWKSQKASKHTNLFFNTFSMIYFLYPERFPFLIFGFKKENIGWTEHNLVGFDLLPIEPAAVTIFWYAFNREFRIRIGRPKIPTFGKGRLKGRLISKFRTFAF